jgi:predicted cobalt transporter CbtA
MMSILLTRGMLVGLVAGLLCFGFLKIVGEPQVDRAIAFEIQEEAAPHVHTHGDTAKDAAAPKAEEPAPELVSRPVQSGIGLFVGVVIYCAAFGGLFALAFAFAHGRLGDFGPRATAALLATAGLIAISIVPGLKYPANPPAVGTAETIGSRTALYFAMMTISLLAMAAAVLLRQRLLPRHGAWNATLLAAAAYLVVVVAVSAALPAVDEVPKDFPATVLWQFRVASLGAQLIMWATLGLLFGALTERTAGARGRSWLGTASR